MKTPRELLLQRHQSVTPRLDAIRRQVVADVTTPPDREPQQPIVATFLREFLLPLRWHLAGMGALWLVAALLSIDRSTPMQTAKANSSPQVLAAALSENRRQLAEMINSPADDAATSTPVPTFIPRRRSALQPSSIAV